MFPDVRDRESHGRTGQILFGGGAVLVARPLCLQSTRTYNFVRDFIRAFFKDFPLGGGSIF